MPVRSVRLAAGTTAPTGVLRTVYTCPAGRTAIVKDVRYSEGAGTTTRCVVQVVSGAGAVHLVEDSLAGLAAGRLAGAFCVLEPGDQIKTYSSGGHFLFYISGAELDGVAP